MLPLSRAHATDSTTVGDSATTTTDTSGTSGAADTTAADAESTWDGLSDGTGDTDGSQSSGTTSSGSSEDSGGTDAASTGSDGSSSTREPAVCGDFDVAASEACEPGLLLADDCTTIGFDGGTVECANDCTFDTAQCYVCGDGEINPGEACGGDDLPSVFGGNNCAGYGGHTGGVLGCSATCSLDASGCTDIPNPAEGEVLITGVRKPPEDVGGA